MRKERTLLFIGIWVVVLQFLGFPTSWKQSLYVITGIAIIYLAYLFYLEVKARRPKDENRMHSFVDNIGSGE